ncbi:hypothetical protein YC2023_039595 [Brassica napus]
MAKTLTLCVNGIVDFLENAALMETRSAMSKYSDHEYEQIKNLSVASVQTELFRRKTIMTAIVLLRLLVVKPKDNKTAFVIQNLFVHNTLLQNKIDLPINKRGEFLCLYIVENILPVYIILNVYFLL